MRTPLESTTHCWLHLQHRTAINIDYYLSGCCGHLVLQKECQRAGMQWSHDKYMQSFDTSPEEDNMRHNDSLFTCWHIGCNCVYTGQCYKTSSNCTSHSLSPADAHSTGDEVFKVRSTDAGGEHDLRGKREEGQGGYKWIGWLATRHRHNIRLMEYHITVSVVTCYY